MINKELQNIGHRIKGWWGNEGEELNFWRDCSWFDIGNTAWAYQPTNVTLSTEGSIQFIIWQSNPLKWRFEGRKITYACQCPNDFVSSSRSQVRAPNNLRFHYQPLHATTNRQRVSTSSKHLKWIFVLKKSSKIIGMMSIPEKTKKLLVIFTICKNEME